jgi:cation diffusion facilitator family transporter
VWCVHGNRLTVYAAVAANLAIATTKFIAAAISGSGAMFSEGIHSVVDTGDGLLLLLGLHLSQRPPTKRHPYGHGREVYFWSMIVAMAIFGMGGGLSIYQGIHHLMSPREIEFSAWTYGVLGAAFVFEGISFVIAMRGFRRARGKATLWEGIRTSKDPTTFIVVLEDSAALIGILLAAAGITLAHTLDAPMIDGITSILIGLLLCVVAAILARETWSLLLGESASPALVESIRRIALDQPAVLAVDLPRTVHLGPELVHVDLDVCVDASRSAHELLEATRQLESAVCREHPMVKRVSVRFPEWRSP